MTAGILQQLGVQRKIKLVYFWGSGRKIFSKTLGAWKTTNGVQHLEELQCNLIISTETLIFAHFLSCYRWAMLKKQLRIKGCVL